MTQVDFYDKDQTDALLADKADSADVYDKDAIDALDIGATTDAESAGGTLWARIKYVLTHWLTSDSEQTITAKKTFSVSPDVPTTPAGTNSAVSSAYVNDTTDGVNNIVHKSGNENISGLKRFSSAVINTTSTLDVTETSKVSNTFVNAFAVEDTNGKNFLVIQTGMLTNGNRVLRVRLTNKNNSYVYKTLFEIDNDGNVIT